MAGAAARHTVAVAMSAPGRPDDAAGPAAQRRSLRVLAAVALGAAVLGAGVLAAALAAFGAFHPGSREAEGGPGAADVPPAAARALARDDEGMAAVIQSVFRSVVNLQVVYPTGERRAATGVVVDAAGLILTNRHVVQDARAISATLAVDDGAVPASADVVDRPEPGSTGLAGDDHVTVIRVPGRVVRSEPGLDLAVLRVPVGGLVPLRLGRSADLRLGQRVIAVGNALALPGAPSVTAGIISGLRDVRAVSDGTLYRHAIQTDAAINEGNSGGPLVDTQGRLVGINSLYIGGSAQDIGFAVPIDQALALIDDARR